MPLGELRFASERSRGRQSQGNAGCEPPVSVRRSCLRCRPWRGRRTTDTLRVSTFPVFQDRRFKVQARYEATPNHKGLPMGSDIANASDALHYTPLLREAGRPRVLHGQLGRQVNDAEACTRDVLPGKPAPLFHFFDESRSPETDPSAAAAAAASASSRRRPRDLAPAPVAACLIVAGALELVHGGIGMRFQRRGQLPMSYRPPNSCRRGKGGILQPSKGQSPQPNGGYPHELSHT